MRYSEIINENITPQHIHSLADKKGVKWDNEPDFLALTKRLTGKEHLDDLDQTELKKVKVYLQRLPVAEQSLEERRKKKSKRSFGGYFYPGYGYYGSGEGDGGDGGGGESRMAEDIFNGIELSIETVKDDEYVDDDDYNNQVLYVKATSGGRELGHVLFAFDGEYLLPQDLEVDERFQGQGIAATMYDYVKSKGYKIRRSGQQTDAGAGFWNKHRPEQNVWEQGMAENFADGKIKGKSRPGRVKRSGASCSGSVSELRARAKKYGGEKGKMYHWCANMKAGKQK